MSDFLKRIIPDSNRVEAAFAARGPARTSLLEGAYSSGFVGAFNGQDELPEWARRAAQYLDDEFLHDTPGRIKLFGDVLSSLTANGDGECHMNCRYALEHWERNGRKGVKPYSTYQDYGSCVDASATEHMTGLFGYRAEKPEFREEYREAAAWYWYADRGYCSDGWSGSGIATVALRRGAAFRVEYNIDGNTVDFRDDDRNEQIVARTWCRSGIPQWLHRHTLANHPFEDGAITRFQGGKPELKKLFAAGGALHHSGTRTSGGKKPFTPGRTGPHMQSAVGYDDSDQCRAHFRNFGITLREDDFAIVNHQTWGDRWSGECGDEYWPAWWGPKPEGAWVCSASWLISNLSLDYAWLPRVKGFARSTPVPVEQPHIAGALFAEQVPAGIAIRGELTLDVKPGQQPGAYKYIATPDGTGRYVVVPKPVL